MLATAQVVIHVKRVSLIPALSCCLKNRRKPSAAQALVLVYLGNRHRRFHIHYQVITINIPQILQRCRRTMWTKRVQAIMRTPTMSITNGNFSIRSKFIRTNDDRLIRTVSAVESKTIGFPLIIDLIFNFYPFSADVHMGEECVSGSQTHEITPIYKLHNDSAVLDQHGSPKKKFRSMLSGHKQIDQLLHTIINYILRDFIDSWFFSLSDNKEFSEFRTRNCIEESVQNVCSRVKRTQWIPLITTKLVDIVAMHARLYRKANATLNLQLDETKSTSSTSSGNQGAYQSINTSSPQRRGSARKLNQHRRNKSETDLNLGAGGGGASGGSHQSVQRTFGNSKFYESLDPNRKPGSGNGDKTPVGDASEAKLITAFFNQCELYRDECLDDQALEGTTEKS